MSLEKIFATDCGITLYKEDDIYTLKNEEDVDGLTFREMSEFSEKLIEHVEKVEAEAKRINKGDHFALYAGTEPGFTKVSVFECLARVEASNTALVKLLYLDGEARPLWANEHDCVKKLVK